MTDVGQMFRVCPVCKQQRAVTHCRNDRACFWLRCKDKACGVVSDLRRHIAITPTGELKKF